MVKRSKAIHPRQVPECVALMYDQFVQGAPLLSTRWGPCISVVPSNKSILLFLCCRDKQRENAYGLWNEVRTLKGTGDAYEFEAADLVYDATWCVVAYHGLTRSQLQSLDKAVAEAAGKLRNALVSHDDNFNDFKNESSAACWPEEYLTYIARMLHGMPCSNEHVLAFTKGHPLDKLDWPNAPLPSRDERLFWMLCHSVPTMLQMLEVLERRARELSSSRLNTKKKHQSLGDASDARFIRRLVNALIHRNPAAPADQIARIISPIVDKVVGGRTLARCKKVAQRIKCELKVDGTISPS